MSVWDPRDRVNGLHGAIHFPDKSASSIPYDRPMAT